MDIQEIEVTIDQSGQVQVRVRGAKGDQCLNLTRGLEGALGGDIVMREMTPEAMETPNSEQLLHHLKIKSKG
ncbi:MAG: DUF2997 domain-containing protein [Anaerolineaceae bacterium]|nr:DUF2997 domain-containing protein [Anaerolineaceae bacterium]